ncbi:MAG: hypothetical protein KY464_09035 [Gemmatimonadetes bacterium]|nr:hypothetical protein [Gemmatimonadota bacterium]
MKRSARLALLVAVIGSGCGPSDAVEVQPLPSLEQSSPEARAGLPRIAGAWRFAGWELAPDDSANLKGELPRFGVISLATQKRDSLAGHYVIQAGRAPLYGELRRDSVIALIGVFGPGDLRFMAGRIARDTVWMELSSLSENWPVDARAAFTRTQVASPFVRLRGAIAPPPVAAIDTLAPAPTAGMPPVGGTPGATPGRVPGVAPGAGTQPGVGAQPPAAAPSTGGAAPPPRRVTPPAPRPRPAPPPPVEEEDPPVPLLGDPTG